MSICSPILRAGLILLAALGLAQAKSLSLDEYRVQLQDLHSRVEQLKQHPEQGQQLESDLPDHVSVSDASREYSVSYDGIKRRLQQFQKADVKGRPVFLKQIQDHIRGLEEEAEAYERAQAASKADQQKLQQILSRREFRKTHGPTWVDVMWHKVLQWFSKWFTTRRLHGSVSTDILQILVYSAVAVAFILFAIWIYKRFARPQENVPREIIPFAPSAKGWAAWLAEAQASARQGDWRNGVHLAYWAGISFLEANGAWKPDRARTPREYLRILGTRKPQYPTLSALTRKFEVIWYGDREAQAADFNEALQQLETLGCK